MRQFHERDLNQVAFAEGQVKTLELPRNNVYRGLWLLITGTITTTGVAPVGLKSNAEHTLLERIEIVSDGKDVIKSLGADDLKVINELDFASPVHNPTPIGIAASTAYNFEAVVLIPFALTRARRPIDAALDSRYLSSLDMRITCGDINSIYATSNSATISNMTISPMTEEYLGMDAKFKAFISRHHVIDKEYTSSDTNLQEKLPVEQIYRRIFILSFADDILVDTMINKIELKSGTHVFKGISADRHRGMLKSLYNLETLATGVHVLNLTTDGQIVEALNTKDMSSLELIFDVTKVSGTNKIRIIPETLVMEAN